MNRRGFIGGIAAFAAACTLDPELALWVPGKRTFFIPDGVVSAEDYYALTIQEAALAAQREAIRPELTQLYWLSSKFWDRIQEQNRPISNMPSRIPFASVRGFSHA